MKTLLMAAMLVFVGAELCAQTPDDVTLANEGDSDDLRLDTPKTIIQRELEALLEKCGILLDEDERSTAKRRVQRFDHSLRQLLVERYNYPRDLDDTTAAVKLRVAWAELGSHLFPASGEFSASLLSDSEPVLPFLVSGQQLHDPKARSTRDNYQLHSDCGSLFAAGLDGEVDLRATWLDSKAKLALMSTFKQHSALSVIYGHFDNRLAQVFRAVKGGIVPLEPVDFEPLVYLWNEYGKDDKLANKAVISSLEAVMLVVEDDFSHEAKTEFDAHSQLKFNLFSVLDFDLQPRVKWAKRASTGGESKIFDIYVLDKPALEIVPSSDQIRYVWGRYQKLPEVKYEDADNRVLLSDSTNASHVSIPFGPVPAEFRENIQVEMVIPGGGTQVSMIRTATRDKEGIPIGDGVFLYRVALTPNKLFFQQPGISETTDGELTIRAFLDPGIAGEDGAQYLERNYRVAARAETQPQVKPVNNRVDYESQGDGGGFAWRISLAVSNDRPISSIKPVELSCREAGFAELVEDFRDSTDDEILPTDGVRILRLESDTPPFPSDAPTHCRLDVWLRIQDQGGDHRRVISARLRVPRIKSSAAAEAVRVSSSDLVWDILKGDLNLQGTRTLDELKTEDGGYAVLMDELGITLDSEGEDYFIPTTLVDLQKASKLILYVEEID